LDFWRKSLNLVGLVRAICYDPVRSALIALISYENGQKNYIIAPIGLQVGITVVSSFTAPLYPGNALPLWNVSLGIIVHNVELTPGGGICLARSAGVRAQLRAREKLFVIIRLPSNEIRLVSQTCWVTVGQVGNSDWRRENRGKAGR
jgi:large subunit ribosomal protein L2